MAAAPSQVVPCSVCKEDPVLSPGHRADSRASDAQDPETVKSISDALRGAAVCVRAVCVCVGPSHRHQRGMVEDGVK